MARSHLARVRKVCLSLPEATEVESWGAPTFRVGKIFAMYAAAGNHHHEGREGLWVKTPHFTQDMLVRGQPSRYFSPPYVGPQGWTGVYLDDDTDWIALTVLLRDAYRVTAPKRLASLVPEDDEEPIAKPKAAAKSPARKSKTPAQKKKAAKKSAVRKKR